MDYSSPAIRELKYQDPFAIFGKSRTGRASDKLLPTVRLMPVSFETFSIDELRRLQATLRRRFRAARIIDVGFGPGMANGRRDPRRPFSAAFLVARKRNPRDPGERIPASIQCRLKRGSKFATFQIPTDIVPAPRMKSSGRVVKRPNQATRVATGCVISWKENGAPRRKWAIVTVGHYFQEIQRSSKTVYLYRTTADRIYGRFLFRSPSASKLDVAVAAFVKRDLLAAGLVPARSIPNLKPRSMEQIKNDVGKPGQALVPPGNDRITIEFEYFFPENAEVAGLGRIRNVVRVSSRVPGAFRRGRSGTVFVTGRQQVSSLQYAGSTGNGRLGLGQSLVTILDWTGVQLTRRFDLAAGSMRLISKF